VVSARLTAATLQSIVDSLLNIVALSAIIAYIIVYAAPLNWPPIRSDGYGYYIYLPAWFIHHDPTFQKTAEDCCGGEFPIFSMLIRWPGTSRWVNPHPMGEALMLVPFFWIADFLTWWSNLPRDGFSFYYQVIVGFAGVVYFIAGVVLLRRVLDQSFSSGITLAALVSIIFGTNLFHYATYDSIFSHAFSFCLCAALLYLVPRWYKEPNGQRSFLLGALCGLIVLVRHTNALLLLFPLLYGIDSWHSVGRKVAFARSHIGHVVIVILVFIALVLPQLALYHYASHLWVLNPYRAIGGFNFRSPQLPNVLFSTQKGLFFWSPILLLAVAGIPFMRVYARDLFVPTIVVLPATAYVIASWVDWQMGASYGHRGFTDLAPVFAVALAAFYTAMWKRRSRVLVVTVATMAVALSVAQMLQYWLGIVQGANTTWTNYTTTFLRFTR
jgi:hypothetical protein